MNFNVLIKRIFITIIIIIIIIIATITIITIIYKGYIQCGFCG